MRVIRGCLKNLLGTLVVNQLKKCGFSSFGARSVFNKWYKDFFKEKRTTLAQKIWAHRRGFVSKWVKYYGVTDENYTDYLPDFAYDWLHPINGPYSKWIDDKLTLRYILDPYSEYLPEYFFHIYRTQILPLMDCPPGFGGTIPDVLRLLRSREALAVKLKAGTFGMGFSKLAFNGDGYAINNEPSSEEQVLGFLDGLLRSWGTEYIITEYLYGHADLLKIWPEAPGVVRIIIARLANRDPLILFADIHFPTRKSGVTTNLARCWVGCLIDINTGRMYNGAFVEDGKLVPCSHHPDTCVALNGVLPNWSLVHGKVMEICSYIPQVRYMGIDLIVTDDGFKIIEINSHPGLFFMQSYFPALKAEPSKGFFTRLLQEKKQAQHSQ